jgi:hypothetical protein
MRRDTAARSKTLTIFAFLVCACGGESPHTLCTDRYGGDGACVAGRAATCPDDVPSGPFATMWSYFDDYASKPLCEDAAALVESHYDQFSELPDPDDIDTVLNGGRDGGGGGGGDCAAQCPVEFSGLSNSQLDAFCRSACCYSIGGYDLEAQATCEAGAGIGSSRCNYCD